MRWPPPPAGRRFISPSILMNQSIWSFGGRVDRHRLPMNDNRRCLGAACCQRRLRSKSLAHQKLLRKLLPTGISRRSRRDFSICSRRLRRLQRRWRRRSALRCTHWISHWDCATKRSRFRLFSRRILICFLSIISWRVPLNLRTTTTVHWTNSAGKSAFAPPRGPCRIWRLQRKASRFPSGSMICRAARGSGRMLYRTELASRCKLVMEIDSHSILKPMAGKPPPRCDLARSA